MIAVPCSLATKKRRLDKDACSEAEVKIPTLNMDVCLGANYHKTGEDPAIRPELDYPEWLWELIDDKQPTVDSKQYWRKNRKKLAHTALATLREKH